MTSVRWEVIPGGGAPVCDRRAGIGNQSFALPRARAADGQGLRYPADGEVAEAHGIRCECQYEAVYRRQSFDASAGTRRREGPREPQACEPLTIRCLMRRNSFTADRQGRLILGAKPRRNSPSRCSDDLRLASASSCGRREPGKCEAAQAWKIPAISGARREANRGTEIADQREAFAECTIRGLVYVGHIREASLTNAESRR